MTAWPFHYLAKGLNKAVLGGWDPSARKYFKTDELTFTVPPKMFSEMDPPLEGELPVQGDLATLPQKGGPVGPGLGRVEGSSLTRSASAVGGVTPTAPNLSSMPPGTQPRQYLLVRMGLDRAKTALPGQSPGALIKTSSRPLFYFRPWMIPDAAQHEKRPFR